MKRLLLGTLGALLFTMGCKSSPASPFDVWHGLAAEIECALDVDLEQLVPRVGVDIAETNGIGGVDATNGVDQDINAAIALDGLADECRDRRRIRDVKRSNEGCTTGLLDFRQAFFRGLPCVAIRHRDLGALARKRASRRASEDAAGSCHDSDLAVHSSPTVFIGHIAAPQRNL